MTELSAHEAATESESRAFLQLLANVCRQFPAGHNWLLTEFAADETTREKFLVLVKAGTLPGDPMSDGFADLVGELAPWTHEKERLKSKQSREDLAPFGGLTWDQMESILRVYEGRSSALKAFQLARDWKSFGPGARFSSGLLLRLGALVDTSFHSGDRRLFDALGDAIDLLSSLDRKHLSRSFGHSNWWKMHTIVYMLKNPKPAYRTREIRGHLQTLGLEISTLDFRRFCKRHGIRRDQRAGRPKITRAST